MPKVAWMVAPAALGGLAMTLGGQAWDFAGGGVCGAALGLALWAWDSPPAYVQNWGDGADGERRTAEALEPLTDRGWRLLHDQPTSFGNRDHIVIGPGGLFLIDTKCPSGRLEVVGDHLVGRRLGGEDFNHRRNLGRSLRGAAVGLSVELRSSAGASPFVHAVAAIWGDFTEGVAKGDRFTLVHGDRLCEWLLAQPRRFTDHQVAELAATVESLSAV
jgi:Nuclease-related domain